MEFLSETLTKITNRLKNTLHLVDASNSQSINQSINGSINQSINGYARYERERERESW
jgi:hypothetical protein